MNNSFIVVTDLDGTLLDHHSYSFAPALPALHVLAEQNIPVILNSSKTAAEMQEIRTSLGLSWPFITENGAAIYRPEKQGAYSELQSFGMQRELILQLIARQQFKARYQFTGFAEMSAEQLVDCTGLPLDKARLALQRDFTEPVLWQDSQQALAEFRNELTQLGITSVMGGRFLHLSGTSDKGAAADWLKQYFASHNNHDVQVIALGDSENDLPMLQRADIPVLVKSPVKPFPAFSHPRLIKTQGYGPTGWNEALQAIMKTN